MTAPCRNAGMTHEELVLDRRVGAKQNRSPVNRGADQIEPAGQDRFPMRHVSRVAEHAAALPTERCHGFGGAPGVKGRVDEQAVGRLVRRADEGNGPCEGGSADSADAAQGATDRSLLDHRRVIDTACIVLVDERYR